MRRALLIMLALSLAIPAFAVKKGGVKYRGGTVAMAEGEEAPYTFTDTAMAVMPKPKHGEPFEIPFAGITKIVYGQPSGFQTWGRWSKSKKHFVTLSWTRNQVTLEFDKNDINRALAVLSARSEVEVERLEEGSK